MQAMKFRVNGPAHSKEIQKALFDAGYGWRGHCKDVSYTDAKYLFASHYGCKEITYEYDSEEYFNKKETEEYILRNGEFVKAGERFKNMKIYIQSLEHSVKVRQTLRDEGYDFSALRWDDPVFVRAGYLYTYDRGLVMKGEVGASMYFKNHPNEEHVLVGDKFVKASEYFKQPETKITIAEWSETSNSVPEPCKELISKEEHQRFRKIDILRAMLSKLENNDVVPDAWFAELGELI